MPRKGENKMARKRMVTRTVITTEVTCLCLDIAKGEPFNDTVVLSGTYVDEKKLLAHVQKTYDNENTKYVHIVDKKEVEKLYGMDETEFINQAKVLDPETRKAVETVETED